MQRQTLESLMGQRNTAHSSHSHCEYQELSGLAAKYIFNMSKSQVKSINYHTQFSILSVCSEKTVGVGTYHTYHSYYSCPVSSVDWVVTITQ